MSFGYHRHNWELIGSNGGISFHVNVCDDKNSHEPTAGLEFHHLTGTGAPDHVDCKLTGGRCWHDGTSLYASESLWPAIKSYLSTGNHKEIFRILESEYDEHFKSSPVSE